MRVRVRVDIIPDSAPDDPEAFRAPEGEPVGGTIYVPCPCNDGKMKAISWAELAAEVAMGLFKLAREEKPEICPATYALRVADMTVAAIDAEDLADIDPTGEVQREAPSGALAHGEAAAFKRDGA